MKTLKQSHLKPSPRLTQYMKKLFSILSVLLCGFGSAHAGAPILGPIAKVTAVADVNNVMPLAGLDTFPKVRSVPYPFVTPVSDLRFGFRLSFTDPNTGLPINVERMAVGTLSFKVYHGATVVVGPINMATSSFNPAGDSSFPNIECYNTTGGKVSTDYKVVTTPLLNVNSFVIYDHPVTFNGTTRPALNSPGDNYRMVRTMSGTVIWNGTTFPFSVDEASSVATVVALPNLEIVSKSGVNVTLRSAQFSNPFVEVSPDLVSWTPDALITFTQEGGKNNYHTITGADRQFWRLKFSQP